MTGADCIRDRGPRRVPDRVLDNGVRDGSVRDSLLPPGSVGARGDLHALLSQDAHDRPRASRTSFDR